MQPLLGRTVFAIALDRSRNFPISYFRCPIGYGIDPIYFTFEFVDCRVCQSIDGRRDLITLLNIILLNTRRYIKVLKVPLQPSPLAKNDILSFWFGLCLAHGHASSAAPHNPH
jgi:hypothetical protein